MFQNSYVNAACEIRIGNRNVRTESASFTVVGKTFYNVDRPSRINNDYNDQMVKHVLAEIRTKASSFKPAKINLCTAETYQPQTLQKGLRKANL